MIENSRENQTPHRDIAQWMQRICERQKIAFSGNKIAPSLADLNQHDASVDQIERLNAIGKHFGIRFREMTGSMRELTHVILETEMVLVESNSPPTRAVEGDQPERLGEFILVTSLNARNRFSVLEGGQDSSVSRSVLRKKLARSADKKYRWLLIQPMFAAEDASRFHYQTGTPEQPLKPFRRFVALLKPEGKDIRAIVIFSVVIGLLSLTLPLAVEAIVNTIAFGRSFQPLIVLSLIVLVFLGFRAGLSVLLTVVTEVIQRRLFVRTVEDLAYRLTRVPLTTWKKYNGTELVNRFFDIVTVQKVTAKLLLGTLMLALQTVIGLSVLAFYHPFLLGYDIGLLTIMAIVLWFIGRGAVKTATAESQLKYETAAWLQEIARHPTAFKFNGGLGYAINRADELTAEYINRRQSHFKILVKQISFAMIMQVFAATVLLALGGFLVIQQELTLGQLVAAELIVTVILGSFAKLGGDLESYYDLMASVDKLGKLFDLPVEPMGKLQVKKDPGADEISLVNVKLSGGMSKPADIEFPAGQTYAIYGGSELLRAQLTEVLVGQQKPMSGHVLLDDYRIDSLLAESLQEKISLIREIELFEGSVDDNLRMGRQQIGSAIVNDIVARLGLKRVLDTLGQGYGTRVSISGYPLSQGEAIRLILARALIAKPGILFVDGLLDRLSDDDINDVLSRLDSFTSDTTIIISTGRQSIARWASQTLDLKSENWSLENYAG